MLTLARTWAFRHASMMYTYHELLRLWTLHSMGQVGFLQLTFHPAAALVSGPAYRFAAH
jgi:hypothetical protein